MSWLQSLALAFGVLTLMPGCREAGPPAPARVSEPSAPVAEPAAPGSSPGEATPPSEPQPTPSPSVDGVPAMTYRARPALDAQGAPQIPYEDLRLGLYDPAEPRFVPLTDPVPSALGGLLDRDRARAMVLAGDLVMGEIWLVQARNLDVTLLDLRAPGQVLLQASDVDARFAKTNQIRVAVQAALAGDDAVRVTLRQLQYDPNTTASVLVTTEGVELTPTHASRTEPRLHVDASGAFVEIPPPAGLSLEGGSLRVLGRKLPLELGPGHETGHRQITRTPDGRFVMVFTVDAGCREVAYARHVLDRVDLQRGTVTRLSDAPVHAGAALGPEGSIFLDAEGRVVRFPPEATTPVDDVLPGVRFATPDYDRDCSI